MSRCRLVPGPAKGAGTRKETKMSAKTNRDKSATRQQHEKSSHQQWRKSSHSSGDSACVEVAPAPDGGASIRDSKNPHGAVLTFSAREWKAFIEGARDGEFNHTS